MERGGVATIPEVVAPRNLDDYLAVVTRAVFQAGVSWRAIAERWGCYRAAFHEFDCRRVAAWGDAEIEAALGTGILRAPRKVRATVANAAALLAIEAEFGSVDAYVASHAEYAALAADMRARFSLLGPMSVWYVLFRTGHTVPRFESWIETIPGEHPRMREMVERARAAGTARER